MKTNSPQQASNLKFSVLSKKEMSKIGGGGVPADMTPKERCEYNNVGRCGACDKDGVFVACA
ncbi:MAG: hypothetical protein WC748_10905 [Legionellales bacterium]|jgi:hypothetical protein